MLERFMADYLMKSRLNRQTSIEHLLAGRCKDYAAYKQVIGRIKGFEEAEDMARKLYASMVNTTEVKHKEISHDGEPESY